MDIDILPQTVAFVTVYEVNDNPFDRKHLSDWHITPHRYTMVLKSYIYRICYMHVQVLLHLL